MVTFRDQRGVALVTVLVVVALLTITVTEFTYSVQLDAYRAQNARHSLQASLLARSGVNLAEGFLILDDDPTYDAKTEEWYLRLKEFCLGLPIGDSMAIRCDVKDESGRINVNLTRGTSDLTSAKVSKDAVLRTAVNCIFQNQNVSVKDKQINEALVDYWSKDPGKYEDGRPRKVPDFTSLEDFGAQFGLTSQELRTLRPYLAAQPPGVLPRINVNFAEEQVLAAVLSVGAEDECGSNQVVEDIMLRRQEEDGGLRNLGEVNVSQLEYPNVKRSLIDVKSTLYRLESSGIANYDPEHPDGGGIGQTISALVRRSRDPRVRLPDSQTPGWTLRAQDWQKEGGARLFWEHPEEDDEEDSEEPLEEDLLGN